MATIRFPARLASPAILILGWTLASAIGLLPEQVMPSPLRITATLVELTASGKLPTHLAVSLSRAGLGLALGITSGTLLAIVAGLSRKGELTADPLMQTVRALPFLGVIPLFILWFGIGELTKVLLIALAVNTPIYLTLYGGIRGVDRKLIEAGRSFGLRRLSLIREVILPGALPSFFVGLRYALGVSLLALVAVEQINATAGIGYMINEARDFMRTDVIMACLLVYGALGLLSDAFVRALEARTLSWRPDILDPTTR